MRVGIECNITFDIFRSHYSTLQTSRRHPEHLVRRVFSESRQTWFSRIRVCPLCVSVVRNSHANVISYIFSKRYSAIDLELNGI